MRIPPGGAFEPPPEPTSEPPPEPTSEPPPEPEPEEEKNEEEKKKRKRREKKGKLKDQTEEKEKGKEKKRGKGKEAPPAAQPHVAKSDLWPAGADWWQDVLTKEQRNWYTKNSKPSSLKNRPKCKAECPGCKRPNDPAFDPKLMDHGHPSK